MNANTYTLDEIQKSINETGYKYVSLAKANGQQVIAYNAGRTTPADRWQEIRRRLCSKQLPDGLYIVLAKNTQGNKNLPDEFYYQKGKPQPMAENALTKPEPPARNNPEVTTYTEVLKLKNRITELEFENKALLKRIDELEEEIEELEEELETAPTTLQENQPDFLSRAGEWIQNTMITVQPIIDKFMEQRDKQIQNETLRLMIASGKMPAMPQAQAPTPQPETPQHQTDAINYTVAKITEFIEAQAQAGDVDKYEELATIYNGAADLNDFYNKVKKHDVNTFNELVKFINNKN